MTQLRILIISLFLVSCIQLKEADIFEQPQAQLNKPNVDGFYAVDILRDQLSGEVWFTENVKCIKVSPSRDILYKGNGALHLKWDKQEGGCDWIGLGVGWDGWSVKNLGPVLNKAAIEFKVYTESGRVNSLPLAVSLEDYTGNAAWLGVFPELISYHENENWGTVTLPLERFGWEEFGADPGNIKQMIIQFEAAGEVYVDEFRIVPYEGLNQYTYSAVSIDDSHLVLDGDLSDWSWSSAAEIDEHKMYLAVSENYLYFSGKLEAFESQDGKKLKPEGVELAFSLNAEANPKRKSMLLSDQLLLLDLKGDGGILNMRKNKQRIKDATLMIKESSNTRVIEGRIPFAAFGMGRMMSGKSYLMELAINAQEQLRWNSPNRKGFESSPAIWGKLEILNRTQ